MTFFHTWRLSLLRIVMVIASLLLIGKGVAYLLVGKTVYANYRGDSGVSLMLIPMGLLTLFIALRLRTEVNMNPSKRPKRKSSQ